MSKFLTFVKTKVGMAVSTAVVAVALVIVVLIARDKGYRTVAVEEVNGTSIVTSKGKDPVNVYEGMHFYSGDDVRVKEQSDLTMLLDMDKYLYAEAGTHFWLEAEGKEGQTKTLIYMDSGSTLNCIKDNLNEGEVYQVDTPNSTMAVRGTVFRVTVYKGSDGLTYTLFECFDGRVRVDLKTEDGEYNGVSEVFEPGEAGLIRGNTEFSEFVLGENGIKREIEYKQIPQDTAEMPVRFIDEGEELCIGKELLMDYTQLADHKMETIDAKESTCTEAGYAEVWCVVCNEVTETVELPLKDHEPGDWIVTLEPTCTEVGIRETTCTVCGEVLVDENMDATGHTWGEWALAVTPTCTAEGSEKRTCSVCNEAENRSVAATGHTAGSSSTVTEATCTDSGVTNTYCSVCNAVVSEGSISATGHSFGGWSTVTAASCGAEGSEERSCSVCGSVETQAIEALEHNMVVVDYMDADCMSEGYEIKECPNCNVVEQVTFPMLDHEPDPNSFALYQVNDGFSCTQGGTLRGDCIYCGMVAVKTYEPGQHDLYYNHYYSDDNVTYRCFERCYICDLENEVVDLPYGDGSGNCSVCNTPIYHEQT